MQVDLEIVKSWKECQERGDVKVLAELMGVDYTYASTLLNHGKGPSKHMKVIKTFYAARKKQIEAINKEK